MSTSSHVAVVRRVLIHMLGCILSCVNLRIMIRHTAPSPGHRLAITDSIAVLCSAYGLEGYRMCVCECVCVKSADRKTVISVARSDTPLNVCHRVTTAIYVSGPTSSLISSIALWCVHACVPHTPSSSSYDPCASRPSCLWIARLCHRVPEKTERPWNCWKTTELLIIIPRCGAVACVLMMDRCGFTRMFLLKFHFALDFVFIFRNALGISNELKQQKKRT